MKGRDLVQYKLKYNYNKKCIKGFKKLSRLFASSNGVFLKRPITLIFKQYNRFFLKLKFFLKELKAEKLRGRLIQFRLVSCKKHAKNIRMGKGASRFLGFIWRGFPGDLLVAFNYYKASFYKQFIFRLLGWFGNFFFFLKFSYKNFFFKKLNPKCLI